MKARVILSFLAIAIIAGARDYPATVTAVYDGDTFTMDVDLGMGVVLVDQKIRLLFYDAPEVRGEEREQGLVVRDRVREMILGKSVTLRTDDDKKGKYGRWLGEIIVITDERELDLGSSLLEHGYVEKVDY
jgi:micrococcal nuclease